MSENSKQSQDSGHLFIRLSVPVLLLKCIVVKFRGIILRNDRRVNPLGWNKQTIKMITHAIVQTELAFMYEGDIYKLYLVIAW